MAADQTMPGAAGWRLGGFFAVCAGSVALFGLAQGKSIAQSALMGISGGIFLPIVFAVVMFLLIYCVDLFAGLLSSVVLIVWVSLDWRNRETIVARLEATELRFTNSVANTIAKLVGWFIGRQP